MTVRSPDGPATADVSALVAKLRRIPDSARRFVETPASARARFLLRPAVLDLLTDAGLPVRRIDGTPHYDRHDLTNCSLHLSVGAAARTARRFWPAALRRVADAGQARYEVQYQIRCPAPGHAATCSFVLVLPGGRVLERTVADGSGLRIAVQVSVEGRWPDLPAAVRRLLDDAVAEVEFMMLPTEVRYDTGFVRASGLGDCAGVTRLLVRRGRAAGLAARPAFGLIVAPPFAAEHFWAEFLVDGRWVPVDPVLIRTMLGWGVLDPAEWHPHRSIGAILSRIADDGVVLAAHDGWAVPFTLPTQLLPEEPR
ncbi:transglutaminase domain-containing protein [Plantactinospora sp. KLBMP9567]|uniref:transglutaminase domain-containing protein n=1 Tax=unclassified Plantactinospora TaxID=2631981 RepID=UPI002980DA68|nr:transglutaminase domain-containing protein [Plantactinospora sp. KLBMP9567]MDW5324876.1 transglutaminase domain-containing protein [Plantactinospora sp. KLBMP9567]